MREIAASAGVSVATVSLSLSGSPLVAEATQKKISTLARQMGYRKNPYVSALMESRRLRKGPIGNPMIAFLTFHDTKDGWQMSPYVDNYTPAALEAGRLGYKLEVFWAADPNIPLQRQGKILEARGIRGILLNAPPRRKVDCDMDWSPFSVVALGSGLQSPVVHRVSCDHFHIAREAVKRCAEGGFKRIALACRKEADDRLQHRWSGAYLGELRHHGLNERIPTFLENTFQLEDILRWFGKAKPDAIVGTFRDDWIEKLTAAGIRFPEDCAYVAISLMRPSERVSGYIEPVELAAATAVQQLIAMISRNETGIPDVPCETFALGYWNPGQTFGPKTQAKPARIKGS
jgi:LacI family transcriptional regulator